MIVQAPMKAPGTARAGCRSPSAFASADTGAEKPKRYVHSWAARLDADRGPVDGTVC